MARIEPLSSSVPYQVNPGNHDVSCHAVWDEGCDKRMLNFSAYRSRWAMPWQQSNAVGSQGLWYSFTMGSVHMVAIDTESDYKGAPIMGASFKVPGPLTHAHIAHHGGFGWYRNTSPGDGSLWVATVLFAYADVRIVFMNWRACVRVCVRVRHVDRPIW